MLFSGVISHDLMNCLRVHIKHNVMASFNNKCLFVDNSLFV